MPKSEHPAEFTVMFWYSDRKEQERLGCPKTLPWGLVWPHDAQARINHGHWQGFERLNERGGLVPSELVAVLMDREWKSMPLAEAVVALKAILAEYLAADKEWKDE